MMILQNPKKYGKYDFVFSLNVFEHYTNWKKIIKSYKNFSKKYFCFTSNLKLEGNASLDFETSFFTIMVIKNQCYGLYIICLN